MTIKPLSKTKQQTKKCIHQHLRLTSTGRLVCEDCHEFKVDLNKEIKQQTISEKCDHKLRPVVTGDKGTVYKCEKCSYSFLDKYINKQTISESNWEKEVKKRFSVSDGDAWDMTDEIIDFIRQEKKKSFEEGRKSMLDETLKGIISLLKK